MKNENLKKILTVVVVLTFFGTSYYYYYGAQKTSCHLEKSIKSPNKHSIISSWANGLFHCTRSKVKKAQSVVEKPAPAAPTTPVAPAAPAPQPEQPKQPTKIPPTDIKSIIANATKSTGKKDPFSSMGSAYMPAAGREPRLDNLPAPPSMAGDYPPLNLPGDLQGNIPAPPPEPVVVKGFLGNKVIADIKGVTESLDVNESLRGIKVLKVDPENYTCDFMIDGKRVTKRMKPIVEPNKNVELDYIKNL